MGRGGGAGAGRVGDEEVDAVCQRMRNVDTAAPQDMRRAKRKEVCGSTPPSRIARSRKLNVQT